MVVDHPAEQARKSSMVSRQGLRMRIVIDPRATSVVTEFMDQDFA